jgi:hypothetical protein
MPDDIPDHWAPNSRSHAGPAVVTLAVLSAVAWLGLGLIGLTYRDSLDAPEGMAAATLGIAGLIGSALTLALTIATAAVAAYHRAVSGRRWALTIAVTTTVFAVALCGFWTAVAAI